MVGAVLATVRPIFSRPPTVSRRMMLGATASTAARSARFFQIRILAGCSGCG